LGVSGTDTPLKGASISAIPAGGLGHLLSGVGELRLAKKALSGCTGLRLKKGKARASGAGTGFVQQPGNAGALKEEETLNKTIKR
jgi:hypothetical protein